MNESVNLYWPHRRKTGISDQLWTIRRIFLHSEIPLTISQKLDVSAYNICVEDFDTSSVNYINDFCDRYSLSVGLLVTEFLDSSPYSGYLINGLPYKNSPIKSRFDNLQSIHAHIKSVYSIACQPEIDSYKDFLAIKSGVCLGFPSMNSRFQMREELEEFDLYFSGELTPYRREVLNHLESRGLRIFRENGFVSERDRSRNLNKSRFMLNIPQREDWKWISTMRVLFAAKHGKFTVHVGGLNNLNLGTVIGFKSVSEFPAISDITKLIENRISFSRLFPPPKRFVSSSYGLYLADL
jgi:hypothetical protein